MFLIGNTAAYSSKQLLISAPQNCCKKSIGKFPNKVAHVSFIQCSVYIVLGQDDCLKKLTKKFYGKIEWEESDKAWQIWHYHAPTLFHLEIIKAIGKYKITNAKCKSSKKQFIMLRVNGEF